ncbi:glycine-rich domain-containing protein [Ferruginibacter sp. SUN002]|uniref:glycine-rich domain-containing protein n=1 Tax=Ferruginibacter sp. SUN002 TaxID=2937789 RepID=UPI003D36F5C9
MKKISLTAFAFLFCIYSNAQNVGIGVPAPQEKLDVNGNINLNGDIKVSGAAGSANQVLMKDATNTLAWGDLSEYKNLRFFDCAGIASAAGASNCNNTWTVPAGVTKVYVEVWGGGGGGGFGTGGSGAGYIVGKFVVTPSSSITITVGAGGNYGTETTNGIIGGISSVTYGAIVLTATGGEGGVRSQAAAFNPPAGGSFNASGLTNYIGYYGTPGQVTTYAFNQINATEFASTTYFGNGGDAAMSPNSGGKGGYRLFSTPIYKDVNASTNAVNPGGGGGADGGYGYYGRGGRVIIHW